MKKIPIEFSDLDKPVNNKFRACKEKITNALNKVLKYCDDPERFDEQKASALLEEVRNEVLGGILAVERLKMTEKRIEKVRRKKKK